MNSVRVVQGVGDDVAEVQALVDSESDETYDVYDVEEGGVIIHV
jgi:hypothetical protein